MSLTTGAKWTDHEGAEYVILGVALDAEDDRPVVVYQTLEAPIKAYVRSAHDWFAFVKTDEGYKEKFSEIS